jgi:hypothetical protein
LTASTANEKRRFQDTWKNCDGLGLIEKLSRDRLVFHIHDVGEGFGRVAGMARRVFGASVLLRAASGRKENDNRRNC